MLCRTHLLDGQQRRTDLHRMGDHPLGLVRTGQQGARCAIEGDAGLRSGEVHGDQGFATHARTGQVHGVETRSVRTPRRDQQDVGCAGVHHPRCGAGQLSAGDVDRLRLEHRGALTLDECAEQFISFGARRAGHQSRDRQINGAEEWPAGQRRAELLDRDGLVHQ